VHRHAVTQQHRRVSVPQLVHDQPGRRAERVGEIAVARFPPDLFAEDPSPWTSQGSDPILKLEEAIRGLEDRQVLQCQLAEQGI